MGEKPRMKLPPLGQIGVVVKNLEKTMKYYESVFGIGPWKLVEIDRKDILVRGKVTPFKMKVAFASLGTVELELIQLTSGKAIYSEFLQEGREGLHHLGFFVTGEGKEQALARLAEEGIEVSQGGQRALGVGSYAYVDSNKVGGVIFEFIHRGPDKLDL